MGEYHGESLLNRSNRNMNSFVVAFSVVACAMGAPTYPTAGVVAPLGYAGGVAHAGLGLAGVAHAGLGYAGLGLGGAAYAGASVAGTPVVSAPAVVGHQVVRLESSLLSVVMLTLLVVLSTLLGQL